MSHLPRFRASEAVFALESIQIGSKNTRIPRHYARVYEYFHIFVITKFVGLVEAFLDLDYHTLEFSFQG